MKRNKNATGTRALSRWRKAVPQVKAVAGDPATSSEAMREVTIFDENGLSERERTVTAREGVSHVREDAADHRENVAQVREHSVSLREDVALLREQAIQEAEAMKTALDKHITELRQANENLIIAALQAQTMTEEIQKAKDQMGYLAHHDFLTGLPNRILLEKRLSQEIAMTKRHSTKLAVLFIDLDRFKVINDSLGHAIGDALLRAVAHRLTASVRSMDTVSRHGGDEFVVLLTDVGDVDVVSGFVEKICKVISEPYPLAGQKLHIGATVGISMYPDDGEDVDALILNADVAMYHAKNSGRGGYHFFSRELNARAHERQSIESDLRRALDRDEFELHYQAQVDLRSGNIIGVEALVRWRHPNKGLLLPGAFVPIAEECGVIVPMGRWILREACRQTKAWLDAGLSLNAVAVNISVNEFRKSDFFEYVRTVLREARLEPHHLELEMTETALMEDTESTMATLQALSTMGVRIAVDDFGTGYSSLSYLRRFPVDTIKIDQSFVAGMSRDGRDNILVDSVINLGQKLHQRVIAEGVETPEQLAFLNNHHGIEGQGYFLSQPMIADEFTALLGTGLSRDLFPRSASLH